MSQPDRPLFDGHSSASEERQRPGSHLMPFAELEAELAELLRRPTLHPALARLNARTRFRFTGVYRLAAPLLHNVRLYDRENPLLNVSGCVSKASETFCSITCASGEHFATEDARHDARIVSHPASKVVRSYFGVPVRLADGRTFGTLCHFDLRRRMAPAGEREVLERAAPLIAAWLERNLMAL